MTRRSSPRRSSPRRSTLGPAALAGLATAGLAAIAATKPLARATDVPADLPLAAADPGELPLAAALSLVPLAAWGVALVTRRRVRRGVLALGFVAAAGTLAALVAGFGALRADVRSPYAGTGAEVGVAVTAWYPVALVAAATSVAALALAWRLAPGWPEMGARYDAPATGSATTREAEPAAAPRDDLDVWRALDQGRDPTEVDD